MGTKTAAAIKESLLRKLFNYTVQRHDFGLVTEFGMLARCLSQPPEKRKEGEIRALNEFIRHHTIPPLKEDLRNFFAFLLEHQGQPQSVRALNTIERMEGKAGNWHDPLSGPRLENQ